MKNSRLYIVMVGLPARGKSTVATKLKESLVHDTLKVKIFNNGTLRRKMITENTSYARFFDPDNKEGVALREKIGLINTQRARKYVNEKGNIAILDATNANLERRKMIRALLGDHPILFVECINEDREILNASIRQKIDLKEFGHLSQEEAITSFRQRIAYYQAIYKPLEKEPNYIKLDSLNNKILKEEIRDDIPFLEQVRDFLLTDMVKDLYLIRHGETHFNIEDRIGGDSSLSDAGKAQATALAEYFRNKEIPLIFTSQKKRTIQTAEPIRELQKKCEVIDLPEFNEIDSGVCEKMSYEEIKKGLPNVYTARKKDKYNYVYPGGEGYVTMQDRIYRGIKKTLYLSKPTSKIMIIGHRAVNRMILSHFLYRRREDVPYIYIPQDRFYYISSRHNKKLFQLKRFE